MKGSRGFMLVSAIFLMVVLVILAASLVTISSVAHTSVAQQLQSTRANFAARTGAEWAAARSRVEPNCALWPSPATLNPGGTLSGFTVTVNCTRTDHPVGSATLSYYLVNITATSGVYGTVDFVQRRVQTKMLGP